MTTTYSAPNRAASWGYPDQGTFTVDVTLEGFITGDDPDITTEDLPFAASQTIAAWTVLAFNPAGDLVPAVHGAVDSTAVPVGISINAIDTLTGTPAVKTAPIYRSGCFNPDLAVWDASWTTPALKLAAFRGSPTPTQIIMRPNLKGASVTLP